jgi:RNA recognition motif-containing protein
MTIYVGNLSYDAVKKISLPIDKMTGRKKGFCFIDFDEENDEDSAISGLNECEFLGRNLKVNKAMSNETKPGSGGGSSRPPFRGGDRSSGGGYGSSNGGGYGNRSGGGSRSGSSGGSRGGFRSGSNGGNAGYGRSNSRSDRSGDN